MATGVQGLLDGGNDTDGIQGIHIAHMRDAEYLAGQLSLSAGNPDAEFLAKQGAEFRIIYALGIADAGKPYRWTYTGKPLATDKQAA